MDAGRQLDKVFALRQLGRCDIGALLILEGAAEQDGIVRKLVGDGGRGRKDALDGGVLAVLSMLAERGLDLGADAGEVGAGLFKGLQHCRTEHERLVQSAARRRHPDADDIVHREGDVLQQRLLRHEIQRLVHLVQGGEKLHVAVSILVAPDVQRAVLHEDGGGLVAAGQLFDLGHVHAVVVQLLRDGQNKGGVRKLIVPPVLSELIVAPAVDFALVVDGDDVVDAGGDHDDVGFLHVLRDAGDVKAGRADLGTAPDVDLARAGQPDREGTVGGHLLYVLLQLLGHLHHAEGGVDALLGVLGVGVEILGHEQRTDKRDEEHHHHHDHRDHRVLLLQEALDDLRMTSTSSIFCCP